MIQLSYGGLLFKYKKGREAIISKNLSESRKQSKVVQKLQIQQDFVYISFDKLSLPQAFLHIRLQALQLIFLQFFLQHEQRVFQQFFQRFLQS